VKQFSPEFQQFLNFKLSMPPGDAPWNPHGFKHDYTDPRVSEMSAHMPLLAMLAGQCKTVTEFGSRGANSTVAFLSSGCDTVSSWDIQPTAETVKLLQMRELGQLPCRFNFICSSTVDPNNVIDETDLLMIDTLHTAKQVHNELKIHSDQVRRFLIFHDTYSQSRLSLDMYGDLGIGFAIDDFTEQNKDTWREVYRVPFNHGLLVLERISFSDD
jgi:hypothetical protein